MIDGNMPVRQIWVAFAANLWNNKVVVCEKWWWCSVQEAKIYTVLTSAGSSRLGINHQNMRMLHGTVTSYPY